VSSRLGYDPFFAWAHDTLIAEITRESGAFRTQVKLVDENNLEHGAREISVRGDDCSDVIDALGLTISLTIDPSNALGGPAPTPSGPATPAPATVAQVPGPPEPLPHSIQSSPQLWSARVGLGAIASTNAAPSPTFGATGLIGAAWRSLSFDLEVRADWPAAGLSDVPPVQVRSWLAVGSLVPCGHLDGLFACPVLSGGVLWATAPNIAYPRVDSGAWLAAGARAGAEWSPFSRVSLQGYAELLGTITQNRLTVDGAGVYKFAPWSAGLGLAVVWRFL
jgi:hypothetical protein